MKGSGRGDPLITVGGQFTGGGLLAGGEADISVRPDQEDARSVAQRRLILGAVRRLRGRRELDQPHEISPSGGGVTKAGIERGRRLSVGDQEHEAERIEGAEQATLLPCIPGSEADTQV